MKLDGKLTAGENIADIGGVKLGFLAYQAWRAAQPTPPPAKVGPYSDDQLYFLGYGQSWCAKDTPEQAETARPQQPALAAAVAGQRRRRRPAGLRDGVRLHGGDADGPQECVLRVVSGPTRPGLGHNGAVPRSRCLRPAHAHR